jgi:hypothetical protein
MIARSAILLLASTLFAQQDPGPQPRIVTPGAAIPLTSPPSDAISLFNGRDMTGWVTADGAPAKCKVNGGEMECATGVGDIYTTELFTDAQLHIEFRIPAMPGQTGQRKGNSGVYLQGCFELQILDGYQNPTYADGTVGALYGFAPPFVNASRKPEEWQSYDIVFRAPRCARDDALSEPGSATVFLNGILVQQNTRFDRKGAGCRKDSLCGPGPLRLQDHSGFPGAPHTVMKFRNIWLRKLD